MAVAAYASMGSLTHLLDNLHYRAQFHVPRVDITQLETFQETVRSLVEFIKLHSETKSPGKEALWRQISEVAFEAEDRIDFHVVNLLHMRSEGETIDDTEFCEYMKGLISKTDYIRKQLLSIKEQEDVQTGKQGVGAVPGVGSSIAFVPGDGSLANSWSSNHVVMGIDNHVEQIIDKLTRKQDSNLQILPIIGMGGIGKTTLAKTVFDSQNIKDYFRIRRWVTISQKYSPERLLVDLLNEGGKKGTRESLAELGDRLYKSLFDQRYLIVVDDIWTPKAWEDIKMYIPNDGKGSRILLTSRLSSVAISLGIPTHDPYSLSFLDEDISWDLFCQTTFGQKDCPESELAEIGRKIAESCRGLPLEIVVIGRLLAKSNMTRESWELVAKNMSSLSNLGDDEHCLKTLSLSYENLPMHLKPCFLYLRAFPEDSAIKISDLIGFWIAEGYIQLESDKSMEEIGNEYFKELIDRNLIFVNILSGAYCGVHDLLRDLCLSESNKECFVQSPKVQSIDMGSRVRRCHLCREQLMVKEGMDLPKQVHVFPHSSHLSPFVCNACELLYSQSGRPRLVRTVDGFYGDSWQEIVQPLGLRYSSMIFFDIFKFVSPSKVHLFWNLQTLIMSVADALVLPCEIWEMPQLRVIDVNTAGELLAPVATHHHIESGDFIVLKHLHTLCRVKNFLCTKEILDRVPNLIDLDMIYRDESVGDSTSLNYSLCNLEQLQKLESLKVRSAMEHISFPNSLKSLSLWHYRMLWEEVSIFGSMPNLEVLQLYSGTQGSKWKPVEGEFVRLKELHLTSPRLVEWSADSFNFPALEELELELCHSLKEIPSGIGFIETLKSIKLLSCSKCVVESGKDILKEQQDEGNEILKLYINRIEYQESETETEKDSNESD